MKRATRAFAKAKRSIKMASCIECSFKTNNFNEMKKNIIKIALVLPILLGLSSCFELELSPEGQLSTVNALSSTPEMEKYVNQFYQSGVKTQPGGLASASGIAYGDQKSDNMVNSSPNTRLAGLITLSGASKLSNYDYIRDINFMIANIGNNKQDSPERNQAIGEAYYFRAWYYYDLVKDFGDVTWVNDVLDMSKVNAPRDSRLMVVDSILHDLDFAISKLKERNNSATMRVHRDLARALKAEVALYEGTWQKYHKAANDAFYSKEVSDAKIKNYFEQARDAAKAIMDRGVWSISKTGNKPYQNLFITLDLSTNPEVLWWKEYNAAENIGHSVTRYINEGGGQTGISQSLVNDYLTIDGNIYGQLQRQEDQKIYGQELSSQIRDPRLSQTVCLPGVQMKPDGTTYQFPPLEVTTYHQNSTGFSMLKFNEYNTSYLATVTGEGKAQAPAIQYRYAQVLLMYAEALAELDGAVNANEIKTALRPLRNRVGMPEVDFDREYNTDAAYPFSDLNKYIQVVRRERRIELACEGFRFDDICRWAVADKLISGKRPLGALFNGSTLETENAPGGYYNGKLAVGVNIQVDNNGYIDPYKLQMPNGFGFNVNRDYLLPISERMISLTEGLWKQNPGW